ncbi:aminotransferase class V-fold PLP-dependent enzyme, partial [Dehalococcoidia bacterium]|nr:aminotransferase class V-fold PLP-dependent enzyme [Dehalococcoidia bacterium]
QVNLEAIEGPATLKTIARTQAVHAGLNFAVAELLNAPLDTIALTQSTTQGLTIVVNGLDWTTGDEVVTCSLEHPAVMLPSLLLQKNHGIRVKIAQINPNDNPEAIISKIEACLNERTRLVVLSHIQFSCGLRLPVQEIAELTHRRGALLLLDGAQCAGQIALDVGKIGCDFYSMSGQKWLLGPEGTGALYIRKELIPEITPRYPAYGAVKEWDQGRAIIETSDDSPRKFSSSTTSTALECGLTEAIAFHKEIGSIAIELRIIELAKLLKRVMTGIPGVTLTGPPEMGTESGLVTFAVAGKDPQGVVEAFWENGIAARQVSNPIGVRLCTAFFNTEDEIIAVGSALERISCT